MADGGRHLIFNRMPSALCLELIAINLNDFKSVAIPPMSGMIDS